MNDQNHTEKRPYLGIETLRERFSQLEGSEQRLRATLYSIGDGVISTDASGHIQQMNPAAEALTGWRKDNAINQSIDDVFRPEMNGKQLHGKILEDYPAIKVLFMSGYTADVIAHHGIMNEGVHFIEKPFNIETLAQNIRQVLDA